MSFLTKLIYTSLDNSITMPTSRHMLASYCIRRAMRDGVEVEKTVHEVSAIDVLTGQKLTFKNESCRFAYRDSIFKGEWKGKCIITSVIFRLSKKPKLNLNYQMVEKKLAAKGKQDVETVREVIIEIRRSKLPDPDELGNTGSFFKNPVIPDELFQSIRSENPDLPSYPAAGGSRKIPAAWLIDQCGWKGKRIGDAGSYEKQPLVLVNYGSATGQNILGLAAQIEDTVEQKFGIRLEKEVNVV